MPRFEPVSLTSRQLFPSDLPPLDYATLGSGSGDWHRFAHGYRQAAECLVQHVRADFRLHDAVVFPILFLYRHYVELRLKALLIDCGEVLDAAERVPAHHRLSYIWQLVTPKLHDLGERLDDPAILRAASLIAELESIDPTSYALRYPVDTKGTATRFPIRAVNVLHVHSVMSELVAILEGAAAQMDYYRDLKDEQDAGHWPAYYGF